MKFKDLKVGDSNIELYALVIDCKTKQTVNQTPYFGLTLSDGEDQADARIWTVNLYTSPGIIARSFKVFTKFTVQILASA